MPLYANKIAASAATILVWPRIHEGRQDFIASVGSTSHGRYSRIKNSFEEKRKGKEESRSSGDSEFVSNVQKTSTSKGRLWILRDFWLIVFSIQWYTLPYSLCVYYVDVFFTALNAVSY